MTPNAPFNGNLRVLIVTSEWPSDSSKIAVPFLVDQVKALRNVGVHADVFAFHGRSNPIRFIQGWAGLRRTSGLGDYDLIHTHFGQSGVIAFPSRLPVVATFHGSDLQGIEGALGGLSLKGHILRSMSQFVARRADRVVVVSAHMTRFLPRGVSADVIPCGIDLERMKPIPRVEARAMLDMDQQAPLVLFVGDPRNPIKRFSLAKRVIERLDHGIQAQLIPLSGEPHEVVPVYMSACDALLVTSAHEGSPTAVKEALACRLPVVAVDVGDIRDRLRGLDECYLSTSGTEIDLATGLTRVLEARRRVSGGREAVQDLSLDATTGKLIDVYRQVLVPCRGECAAIL